MPKNIHQEFSTNIIVDKNFSKNSTKINILCYTCMLDLYVGDVGRHLGGTTRHLLFNSQIVHSVYLSMCLYILILGFKSEKN